MKKPFPTNREIKLITKGMIRKTLPLWIRITILLVALQVACYFLRMELGGTLSYFLMDIKEYPTAATGFFPTEGGFSLILRMDLLGYVIGMPLTFVQIRTFILVNLVTFVLLAPLVMAVMERYWASWAEKPVESGSILRWYINPVLAIRAVAVQLTLGLGGRLLGILAMAPGTYLYFRIYTGAFGPLNAQVGYIALGALAVLLLGALLALFFNSILLPIQFCLAACPGFTVGQAVRQGLGVTKGRRWRFCWFRLSFVGWFLLSQLTFGALDLYVLPYASLSAMRFVQEQAWQIKMSRAPAEENALGEEEESLQQPE